MRFAQLLLGSAAKRARAAEREALRQKKAQVRDDRSEHNRLAERQPVGGERK